MGPGLLESLYRECLLIELAVAGMDVECERVIAVDYKGRPLRARLRIDLPVNSSVLIELRPWTACALFTSRRS